MVNAPSARTVPATIPLRQAGFITRATALVMDIVFVTAGSIVFAALVSLILNFFGFNVETFSIDNPVASVFGLIQVAIIALSSLAVLLFVPGYFVLFWVLIGATPGKQVLGLKIIRTDTKPLGWIRAIVRFVGYFISAIAFFLGFLWVFIDGRRQGWHDKLADTFVVYSWDVTKQEAAQPEPRR